MPEMTDIRMRATVSANNTTAFAKFDAVTV